MSYHRASLPGLLCLGVRLSPSYTVLRHPKILAAAEPGTPPGRTQAGECGWDAGHPQGRAGRAALLLGATSPLGCLNDKLVWV